MNGGSAESRLTQDPQLRRLVTRIKYSHTTIVTLSDSLDIYFLSYWIPRCIVKIVIYNHLTSHFILLFLLKLAEKRKTTRLKAETTRLKECRDDEVWRKVTEGGGTMWWRFDEEEKCWRVWGGRKTGVIRQWRTRPQLMCCALACGTRCPLISGAQKTMRMTENKARMYMF